MDQDTKKLKKGSLLGSCRIKRLIGRGRLGEVYLGHDEIRNRDVALKVVSPETSSKEAIKKFTSIGQTLVRLDHPYIAKIHALGEEKEFHYIVMEYAQGRSLHELSKAGPMPVADALRYMKAVLEGVRAFHEQGIIHQDIKLKNMMVSDEGVVKLVDFGIGRVEGQELAGLIYYFAPEVIHGEVGSVQSDIWSAGISLYILLTGKKPFQAESSSEMVRNITEEPLSFEGGPEIPEDLRKIVLRMCEKLPMSRYASVTDVLKDVRAFESGESISMLPLYQELPQDTSEPNIVPSPVSVSINTNTSFRNSKVTRKSPSRSWGMIVGFMIFVFVAGWMLVHQAATKDSATAPANVAEDTPVEGQKLVFREPENIRFVWSGKIEPNLFVQISKNHDFVDPIADEAFPSSPYLSKNKVEEGIYYWRLVRREGEQVQPVSEPISFTVVTQAAPSLVYPHTQTTSEGKGVQFFWLSKMGVNHYRFQLASDPGFEHLVTDGVGDAIQAGPLDLNAGEYYWRVRGEEPPSITSLWSEVRTLRVGQAVLAQKKVTPPSPAPAPVIAAKPVVKEVAPPPPAPVVASKHKKKTVVAAPAPRPAKIKKAVAKRAPPPEPKPVAVERPVHVAPSPRPVAKVSAPAPKHASPQRKVASIEVVPPPMEKHLLETAKLKLPPDGASIVSLNGTQDPIVFRWTQVPSADQYRLEVAMDAEFNQVIYSMTGRETQIVVDKKMPRGHLFWRVRGIQGSRHSDWSSAFSFDVSQ